MESGQAHGNEIVDNTVEGSNGHGIHIWSSNDNEIRSNAIASSGSVGIELRNYSYRNAVLGNDIADNDQGVRLTDSHRNT